MFGYPSKKNKISGSHWGMRDHFKKLAETMSPIDIANLPEYKDVYSLHSIWRMITDQNLHHGRCPISDVALRVGRPVS